MSTDTKEKPKAKTRIRPVARRLLVRRDAAADKTAGGIVLPDVGKEKPRMGTVLEAGPGSVSEVTGKTILPVAKTNDRIVFSSYAGTEVKIDGEEFLIIESDDVLAVIEDAGVRVD